ncbi:MAG: M48 family metalloprotease [Phycisphaeraceae bacterium]|nr:M48 family metalloprotease [Phycisphaeraceae bacterium]
MHLQIFIILLIATLLGYQWMVDSGLIHTESVVGFPSALVLLIVPRLVLGLIYWLMCRMTLRRLAEPTAAVSLHRLDQLGTIYRLGIIVCVVLDFQTTWPLWLYRELGLAHVPLVWEIIMLAPAMLMLGWSWWCYFPIEQRLRQAVLIRRMDEGMPIYPIAGRLQFVIGEFRHKIALLLVPMLLMLGWVNIITVWIPADARLWGMALHVPLLLLGVGGILLFSPLVVRWVWDTHAMADGELRHRLIEMCRMHGVHVRGILVWNTWGTMINGAVVGFTRRLRFILLTDALLETMKKDHVEAVMAHELGHVRKRHMPWMLLAAMTAMIWINLFTHQVARFLEVRLPFLGDALGDSWALHGHVLFLTAAVFGLAVWLVVFGWISRRFERQADTFAAIHLARYRLAPQPGDEQRGDEAAEPAEHDADDRNPAIIQHSDSETVAEALLSVARLNHFPPQRSSWRHGSIQWRCDYLKTLPGRTTDDLPIDRLVSGIQVTTVIGLIGLILLAWQLPHLMPIMP